MANHRLVISHILKWEGKYGSDPRDGALNYGHSGVLMKTIDPKNKYANYPIHTVKGITWGTYSNAVKKQGKKPNSKEFITMSDELWLSIFKPLFWDDILGDYIKSQGVAEMLVEAKWMGGGTIMIRDLKKYLNQRGAKLTINGTMNMETVKSLNSIINSKIKEKELIEYLVQVRFAYLKSTSSWSWAGKGWTNRLNELKNKSMSLISDLTYSNAPELAILIILTGFASYKLYKLYK